jgi:hypothetical protein
MQPIPIPSRKVMFAIAAAAVLIGAPERGTAVSPMGIVIEAPSNNPLVFSKSTTASTSASNFVTMRGNVSRFWFNLTGFATNDVTNRANPPYKTSVTIFCNDLMPAYVNGPVSNSVIANNILNVACPPLQYGHRSLHWAWAD